MSDTINYIPQLSNGLIPFNSSGQPASIISNGQPNLAFPVPVTDQLQVTNNNYNYTDDNSVTVTTAPYSNQVDLDNPQITTLIPQVAQAPLNFGITAQSPDGGYISYAGTNIQALIEIGDNPDGNARFSKQLIELTTISISIHRAKSPASALGFIGVRGYARGRRTAAGTMVFTQFTRDVLAEFLNSNLVGDLSKDTNYVKVDQLPSFNLTLLFTSEHGYMSYRRLYGINFVTDGTVYSTNDLFTEQTISYVCSDFSPLLPLGSEADYKTLLANPIVSTEKTPGSVLAAQGMI